MKSTVRRLLPGSTRNKHEMEDMRREVGQKDMETRWVGKQKLKVMREVQITTRCRLQMLLAEAYGRSCRESPKSSIVTSTTTTTMRLSRNFIQLAALHILPALVMPNFIDLDKHCDVWKPRRSNRLSLIYHRTIADPILKDSL